MNKRAALSFQTLVVILAHWILLSGCGNTFSPPVTKAPANSIGQLNTSSANADGKSFSSCGGNNSISPVSSLVSAQAGSGTFTVCSNDSNAMELRIEAAFSAQKTICLFPAVERTNGLASPLVVPRTNTPAYVCGLLQNSVTTLDFTGLGLMDFNAAYIIEDASTSSITAMKLCVVNPSFCRMPYSYGRIK